MKNYDTEKDFETWFQLLSHSATHCKYKDWYFDYWFEVQENPDAELPFSDGHNEEECLSCKYASLSALKKQEYLKQFPPKNK